MVAENRQNWATPSGLFAAWHAEYAFDIDVCAEPWNAKLPAYFTEEQNGLQQSWAGKRCYANPPYDYPEQWLEKAWDEADVGARSAILLPVREDASWWHKYAIFAELHYFRGRIKFMPPADLAEKLLAEANACGKKWTNNPKFGNVLVRIGGEEGKDWFPGRCFSRSAKTGLYHVE